MELGLARVAGHIWRFVSRDSAGEKFDPYSRCVGSSYRTKGEALADLDRFATDYGAAGATDPATHSRHSRLALACAIDEEPRALPVRMWVNQPSTSQTLHHLHGRNVLAICDYGDIFRIYFLDGPVESQQAPRRALSEGWL